MTEKATRIERLTANIANRPVPMKLFAAWEVDRTPSNCIPRLCSLTITRLSLLMPLPTDLTSVSLAVKMQSSKRTLRSHEIQIPNQPTLTVPSQQMGGGTMASTIISGNNVTGTSLSAMVSGTGGGQPTGIPTTIGSVSSNTNLCGIINSTPVMDTELDLHFSLQYPHFIKRDGNRLLILLQRRKKYKSRTILGYKTLAEGVIRMDAVLQKSMDMTVELVTSSKAGRQSITIATLRAERVSSIPVDHDNKNNNSVLLTDRVNEFSDDDDENELSSAEDNDELGGNGVGGIGGIGISGIGIGGSILDSGGGYEPKRGYGNKRDLRKYRKLDRDNDSEAMDDGALGVTPIIDSDSEFENLKDKGSRSSKISRQRNFKQKIVALLKRFRVPEELEGAVARGPVTSERELESLFQELDSLSCGDDSGPDMDSISVGSTPKPSLRPFFTNSRNQLHEELIDNNIVDRMCNRKNSSAASVAVTVSSAQAAERRDSSGPDKKSQNPISNSNTTTPDRTGDWKNDSSGNEGVASNTDHEAMGSDTQPLTSTGSPPRNNEKEQINEQRRSRLFRATSSSTPSNSGKKKQSLSLSSAAEPGTATPIIKSVLETCLSPTNVEPRKLLLDQLTRTFSSDEGLLPDVLSVITPAEAPGGQLAQRLAPLIGTTFRPTFLPHNTAEVKAVMNALMNKIQKYCNTTAKPPSTIKVLLVGGDWLQGAVLRHYVDLLAVRPPDWVNHIRFYIVPIGSSTISRYLSIIDHAYGVLFGNDGWHQLCEKVTTLDSIQGKTDLLEMINLIQKYVHAAGPCTQIPIAEAMVNYKDEDSCQIFVPFVSDVRVGCPEQHQLSLDLDESLSNLLQQQQSLGTKALSGSPPLSGRTSPPVPLTPLSSNIEPVELQIDYWPIIKMSDKDKNQTKGTDQSKNSIKSTFRSLQVCRLPTYPLPGETYNGLIVNYSTKEKKQKIMRLGKKKEKDKDSEKEQCIEGVARLICSPKQSHPIPLRVYIDGTEWTGVKFFQLSSQWQTHVKNFPVALIGVPMGSTDLT